MKASRIIMVVIVLLLIIAVGAVLRIRNVSADYDKTIKTNAVQKNVEIWHDSAGVPHIWAQAETDLYFAQGFAHAQERLWQMELFRRVGEGRLSEILGESMIETDKFLRTVGIWRAAADNEMRLDVDSRRLLNAYVAGVNYWIDNHDGPLPPEFTILRLKPAHWTVRNSLAIEKIMAWDLAEYEGAASLTQAARKLGLEKAKYLEPSDPDWGLTIIEAASIAHGSNGWVVGGSRTTSGKPILANDMHLSLRQPGVWYLMALHAPDLDVVGMSLPGVPNIVAGHNKAVAWGFTNVMMDDVDFFIEREDEPLQLFDESIKVKGKDQPIKFTVRVSKHGPIVSDVDKRLKGDEIIAMRWASNDTSNSLEAFPRFNRAHNAQEFLSFVPLFDNPHQNIVYADTAGHFGYQMGGRIPLRGERKKPPMLPVPGWTGEWDWNGYLSFAEQPHTHDPSSGYAVTANNRQVRSEVGDLISNDWDLPFRAMRIREMILAQPKHDAASVHTMQLDVKDLLAVRYQQHAVNAARAAAKNDIAQTLASWDGKAERGSKGAAYFYAWYETMRRLVGTNIYGTSSNVSRDVMNTALDSGRILWLGDKGKGTLDSLSRVAMQKADSVARGKTWGDMHKVLVVHGMGEIAALNKVFNFNVGPEPHRGSPNTVNVAQYTAKDFPLTTSYGPSERHVVDMADVDGSGGFILPTGQSGYPKGKHYADMFARWRNGGLWLIPLDRKKAEARVVNRMMIRPE
ncbi:MAG TPA: penicillin acylase family protein [Longimicrobiales bacterium]|nr:penicillin acylase family protein [Longimicrobiales bacterium]